MGNDKKHRCIIVYDDERREKILAEFSIFDISASSGLENEIISDDMFVVAAKIKMKFYHKEENKKQYYEIIYR